MKLHPMTTITFTVVIVLANAMIAFGYFRQIATAAVVGSFILAFASFIFGVIIGGAIVLNRMERDQ